ncbi:MAG: 50S ribosomal protein L13 [Spirochaetes bacterium]|nr:50S ribosomal protein L13 [Spirochaetota bacterium]
MGLQKTYSMKASEIEKKWFLIDAEGKILGRVATKIANILRGKNKPSYTPHLDMGDNIVVINAEKIVLSGTKEEDKKYYSHSHYPGGIKFTNIKKIRAEKPEYILEHAVKGMLPKNKLGKRLFLNVKIYKGEKHPHEAQKPEKLEV